MARPSTHEHEQEHEQPEATIFWRWVWTSVRPVLGYVLVSLGLVLLLTAYFGVSREVLVARQIPYLVSGGMFGLAAVTLGSRLMLIEDLRRDAGRLDAMERTLSDLRSALLSRPDAPRAELTVRGGAASNGHQKPAILLALQGGDSFHRADCPLVEGKTTSRSLTATSAQRKGLTACLMCQPLAAGV